MRGSAALCVVFLLVGGCAARPQPPVAPVAPAPVAPPAAPVALAAPAPPAPPRYACDQGIEFSVRFVDGAAELDIAGKGRETLLRDAGGVTPQQTVYSSTKLKAEFGLEPDGRGARLNFVTPPIEARCTRS